MRIYIKYLATLLSIFYDRNKFWHQLFFHRQKGVTCSLYSSNENFFLKTPCWLLASLNVVWRSMKWRESNGCVNDRNNFVKFLLLHCVMALLLRIINTIFLMWRQLHYYCEKDRCLFVRLGLKPIWSVNKKV